MSDVPEGYRMSEVGVIPEEWEVKNIENVAPLQRGFDMPNNELEKGEYPVVYSNGIVNYHYTYKVKAPGVVTGRSGTIGKVTFVEVDYWPHNTSLCVTDFKGNDPKFIYYLYLKIKLERFGTGSGVPTLNRNDVHSFKISLPSTIEEQQAIASALSDVDALITALEQLITKKRNIKQGAMQQLLTGEKRLPGFSGVWEMKTLENVCAKNGLVRGPFGGTLKKEFFVRNGSKVYEQKNAIYRNVNLGNYFIDKNKFNELKRFEVEKGDFIVSCSGTIGKIYQIPKSTECGIINQALLKIKTDGNIIHDRFFFYYFDWEKFQEKIIDNTQGGAMQNLVGMNIFRNTQILLPQLPEQQAITQILSDMDTEIEALEQKRDKYKTIKQGMMQELLTGKTRLAKEDKT